VLGLPAVFEEEAMVEVDVADVLARVAVGMEERLELPVDPGKLAWQGRVVVLRDRGGTRELPIWTGAFEGDLIAIGLNGLTPFRPMPYDLMRELVQAAGAHVERVAITSWHEGTCYATVSLKLNGSTKDLDARPSDALALAVRARTPVFASERVLHEHGVPAEGLAARLETDMRPGNWRSLRRT
jgi:bifunctional DNase/RNase